MLFMHVPQQVNIVDRDNHRVVRNVNDLRDCDRAMNRADDFWGGWHSINARIDGNRCVVHLRDNRDNFRTTFLDRDTLNLQLTRDGIW